MKYYQELKEIGWGWRYKFPEELSYINDSFVFIVYNPLLVKFNIKERFSIFSYPVVFIPVTWIMFCKELKFIHSLNAILTHNLGALDFGYPHNNLTYCSVCFRLIIDLTANNINFNDVGGTISPHPVPAVPAVICWCVHELLHWAAKIRKCHPFSIACVSVVQTNNIFKATLCDIWDKHYYVSKCLYSFNK